MRWAAEPLHIVLHEDPEGGINFFKRMEGLADRQAEVREVYLACLAFGYRGKYAEFETTQQASQLGAVRQRLVREILREPLDKLPQLFPGGYRPAQPPAATGSGTPRWWLFAGIGVAVLSLVLWIVLFVLAGRAPRAAEEAIKPLASTTATPAGEAR
jgi:type VI secretion system protein ImpK